jgi:hypothetical protein
MLEHFWPPEDWSWAFETEGMKIELNFHLTQFWGWGSISVGPRVMFVVGVNNDYLVEHSRQADSSPFQCPAGVPVAGARGGSLFDAMRIRHRPLVPLAVPPATTGAR